VTPADHNSKGVRRRRRRRHDSSVNSAANHVIYLSTFIDRRFEEWQHADDVLFASTVLIKSVIQSVSFWEHVNLVTSRAVSFSWVSFSCSNHFLWSTDRDKWVAVITFASDPVISTTHGVRRYEIHVLSPAARTRIFNRTHASAAVQRRFFMNKNVADASSCTLAVHA